MTDIAPDATILDVAELILETYGPLSTMKLHKLSYFAYAWSLVLNDEPIFEETFEAWQSGPVSRALYETQVGELEVSTIPGGDASRVSSDGRDIITILHRSYVGMTGLQLSELSRRGGPWEYAYFRWQASPEGAAKHSLNESLIRTQFTCLWADREVRFPQPR